MILPIMVIVPFIGIVVLLIHRKERVVLLTAIFSSHFSFLMKDLLIEVFFLCVCLSEASSLHST